MFGYVSVSWMQGNAFLNHSLINFVSLQELLGSLVCFKNYARCIPVSGLEEKQKSEHIIRISYDKENGSWMRMAVNVKSTENSNVADKRKTAVKPDRLDL